MITDQKTKECEADVSRESALLIIQKHLRRQVPQDLELQDGIPEGYILYGVSKDEPCWTVSIPSSTLQVGAGRIICISKRNAKVIFDGLVGE